MTDSVLWAKRKLEYTFSDSSLLDQALTHRSASKRNNERLEFLGDAMLNFVIARQLYLQRPDDAEGDLSRGRAALVNKSKLAEIGRKLGIDAQLVLGAGELRSGGAQRSSALADAVEALIGAVLLDGGHDAADALIQRLLGESLAQLPPADALKDAKTRLQEWLQGRGMDLPAYAVENVHGRDHNQVFIVSCQVTESGLRTEGKGPSRRRAEQDAAELMMNRLNGDSD